MAAFTYKGLDTKGKPVSGTLEAVDRKQVLRRLQSIGVRPLQVAESRGTSGSTQTDGAETASDQTAPAEGAARSRIKPWARLQSRDKVGLSFLRRLLDLHSSGMPLGDSVRLLSVRLSDPQLKGVAQTLWRELSEGRPLADAMRTAPQYFPESITYVVEAGEATGRLVPILERIVTHLEEKHEIRSSVLRGISYPLFLVTAATGVAAYLIFGLLPSVQGMLRSLGGEINWAMWLLIEGSDFLIRFGPVVIIAAVVAVVAVVQWRKTTAGRMHTDDLLLKIPLFGRIFYYSQLLQLTSLIGTLIRSDINLTESLRLCERTIQNHSLRSRFRLARTQINEGLSLSLAFKRNRIMPELSLDILAVGENTGNLSNGLQEISRNFRSELDNRLRLMTTTITTGAMVVAFLLVALVAFGMVSSIFQVSKAL